MARLRLIFCRLIISKTAFLLLPSLARRLAASSMRASLALAVKSALFSQACLRFCLAISAFRPSSLFLLAGTTLLPCVGSWPLPWLSALPSCCSLSSLSVTVCQQAWLGFLLRGLISEVIQSVVDRKTLGCTA